MSEGGSGVGRQPLETSVRFDLLSVGQAARLVGVTKQVGLEPVIVAFGFRLLEEAGTGGFLLRSKSGGDAYLPAAATADGDLAIGERSWPMGHNTNILAQSVFIDTADFGAAGIRSRLLV